MASYYLWTNGRTEGPYSEPELNLRFITGEFDSETAVIRSDRFNETQPWKNEWQNLGHVLSNLNVKDKLDSNNFSFQCCNCLTTLSVSLLSAERGTHCLNCNTVYKLSVQKLDPLVILVVPEIDTNQQKVRDDSAGLLSARDISHNEIPPKTFAQIHSEQEKMVLTKDASSEKRERVIESENSTKNDSKNQISRSASKLWSWKSFAIALLITFVITVLAGFAGQKPRPSGFYWTLIWMVLTVQAWKYWKWRSLIPYPAYLVCASLASLIIGIEEGEILDARIIAAGLNVLGIAIFTIIYYHKYKREKRDGSVNYTTCR